MDLTLTWQDILITIGNALLNISLLIGVFHKETQVPLVTSIPSTIGLLLITIAFYSLGLVTAAIATTVSCLLWAGIVLVHPDINQKVKKLR